MVKPACSETTLASFLTYLCVVFLFAVDSHARCFVQTDDHGKSSPVVNVQSE